MPRLKQTVKPEHITKSVSQTRKIIKFTEEQEVVLNADVSPGQIIFVRAIAGAGKTATLIEYMRRRPKIKFLYLAYNKSAIEEVRLRIAASEWAIADAQNITCRTIDSLAAGSSKVKFTGQKKWSIFWFSMWPNYLKRQRRRRAPAITQELLSLFQDHHTDEVKQKGLAVWSILQDYSLGNMDSLPEGGEDEDQRTICLHAQHIWIAIKSGELESPDFSWTVKSVAEQGESLDDLGCAEVDIVIVDEAQDINWPMWSILRNQIYSPTHPVAAIMVGDPNQHLYSFRQCISVFDDVTFPSEQLPTTYSLTRSCRFGPSIAEYANMLLRSMATDMVVGTIHEDRSDSVQKVGFNFPKDLDNVLAALPEGHRAAVLFQSNKAMLNCYLACPHEIEILGSSFGSGTLNTLWEQYLLDPSTFSKNFKVKSDIAYSSSNKLQDPDLAESLRDELFFSEFILRNSRHVPALLIRLQQSLKQNTEAKLVFSTVHQAKGREFHTVVLHPGIRECRMQLDRKLREATASGRQADIDNMKKQIRIFCFLHYTAVTRACYKLIIP